MELRRISADGGAAEPVEIGGWDWGESTGRLRIHTVRAGDPGVRVPARLSVSMGDGHPLLPDGGQPRFDGENGLVFFYSPGVISVEAPAGPVEVSGVQGLATPLSVETVEVRQGEVTEITVAMEPLWDAEEEGWLSGEHHFHLNYGGPFQVAPDDLQLQVDGEALDAASPLLANLHHRFGERELWGGAGRPIRPTWLSARRSAPTSWATLRWSGSTSCSGPGYGVRATRPTGRTTDPTPRPSASPVSRGGWGRTSIQSPDRIRSWKGTRG
jgi:hypothetical protein